ncbi:MAG TPA: aminoacyl-tRNA hydrolase [Phycisphaerales bacterium]|nr:aminoacyl-tRNA hydrolase [Phycisphaerales bacterium]
MDETFGYTFREVLAEKAQLPPATHRLIVGLGNPGAAYDLTRHNVGFMALDALAERLGVSVRRKAFNALAAEASIGQNKLILLKPQQYMNRSGHAVATAAGYYKIPAQDIIVVLDDMALPTGQIRLRAKGSAGGHNGLKDIIARLGTDAFARLRIGIGQADGGDASDYVLSRFDPQQRSAIEQAVSRCVEALLCWVEHDIETAMNHFNSKADANGQNANRGDVPRNKTEQNP